MYEIIFVIIIAAIIFTSSNDKEELTAVSNSQGEMEMPKDAVHQGMGGKTNDGPSKSNVKEDFWTKLENSKIELDLSADR